MKYHAFILPIYKSPNLVARIVKNLQADNHYFFLHVDAKTIDFNSFVIACKGLKNVEFVHRIPVYWGTISQVYATLIMLDATLKSPVHFDYVHQISGNDYPLRSNEQFDAFFENTQDSFMCYNNEKDMEYWSPIYSKHTNKWVSNGDDNLIERIILRIANSRFRKSFPRKPIKGLAGSWDWWSWSDVVVDCVLSGLKDRTVGGGKLLKRFNHTSSPSEHFFATLLYPYLDKLKIRKHFPLRYISWQAYRPIETKKRPYNLNELDYERVINSAAFFCRKVDEVESAKLLDMIDAQRGTHYDITEHDYYV